VAALGGIETGGTKWVCAVGTGPEDVRAETTIPTTTPEETIGRAVAFFEGAERVAAVGIGSFGPVDLRRGWITTTPKPGWADTDVAGAIGRALGVPVAFDTDVNAAALGEHRWGAARGLDTFLYVTVGTGVGGGGMAGGSLLHGLSHPELGHVRIPHDPADPFPGCCPYHGDCLEGLASGTAIAARAGRPAHEVDDPVAWELEARYLGLGLAAAVCVLSPERIVLGGSVMRREGLLEDVAGELERVLAGYVEAPRVVAPQLAPRSGVLGAIALASGGELTA
jgi:fructokinase